MNNLKGASIIMAGLVPFNSRGIGFHNMLDDFFDDSRFFSRNLAGDTFKIDIRDTEEHYLIDAEMSGVPKENVSLDINGDILTISTKEEQSEQSYLHRERRTRAASRSIRLADADTEGITANMENGVLTVSVPKMKNKQTNRNIAIN